jgi:hypothetical protein
MDVAIDPEEDEDADSAAAEDVAPREDDVADEEPSVAPSAEPVVPAAKTSNKRKAPQRTDGDSGTPAYVQLSKSLLIVLIRCLARKPGRLIPPDSLHLP